MMKWIYDTNHIYHLVKMDRVVIDDDSISSLIPGMVQDTYHLVDLIHAVRNPLFQLPRNITYNRFKVLVSEISRIYHIPDLLKLASLWTHSVQDIEELMSRLDDDIQSLFDGLMVTSIDGDSLQNIENVQLETKSRWVDTVYVINPSRKLSLVHRCILVYSISTDLERECVLRFLAAENNALSVRAAFMITDMCFPLRLIPGIVNHDHLIQLAAEANDNRSSPEY